MELDSRPRLEMQPMLTIDRPRQILKAQRDTRAELIAMTGERRQSQVWFAQYHGAEAARNALHNLGLDGTPTPADVAALDQAHTFLSRFGDRAVLVVAACEVTDD